MSLSTEEQILRELQLVNAQLNPGKALLKAFGLLVLLAIAFTGIGVILSCFAPPRRAVHARPVSRGVPVRPLHHHNPQPTLIKEIL